MSRGRKKIRPYPADWSRAFDLVKVLGLQVAVGGGSHEVTYLRGTVSFQTEAKDRVPSETKKTGKLGSVTIRSPTKNYVEYSYAAEDPLDTRVKPQSEILEEIASGLGLERREEALGVNIQERMTVTEIPDALEDLEPLQGYNYIYHKQSSTGDFTDLISRALGLRRGALRSPTRQIINELIGRDIIGPKDPVRRKIRGILRTDYLTTVTGGYYSLAKVMDDIHRELASPNWWQEVGYPRDVKFQDGFRPPKNAQIYDLEKRNRIFAVPLPKELFA